MPDLFAVVYSSRGVPLPTNKGVTERAPSWGTQTCFGLVDL